MLQKYTLISLVSSNSSQFYFLIHNFYMSSGAQPEIFQGRAGFVELGHFNKLFVKTHKKKGLQGKILELFLLDTLKTTF